jgi:hypothetical protein
VTGEVLATQVSYGGDGPASEASIEGRALSIGVARA